MPCQAIFEACQQIIYKYETKSRVAILATRPLRNYYELLVRKCLSTPFATSNDSTTLEAEPVNGANNEEDN